MFDNSQNMIDIRLYGGSNRDIGFRVFCGGNLLSHDIFYRFQNFMASVIMTCSNRSSVHNIISLVQGVKELLLRRN